MVYTEFRPTPLQHYIFPNGADGLYLVKDEKVSLKSVGLLSVASLYLMARVFYLAVEEVEVHNFKFLLFPPSSMFYQAIFSDCHGTGEFSGGKLSAGNVKTTRGWWRWA